MTFTAWDLEANEVLALPLDDLGLRVLKDARDNNEWNWQNWLNAANQRAYPGRKDVLNVLSEAWAWLLNRGLVAGMPHYGTTTLDPAVLLARPELELFLWMHAPGLQLGGGEKHGVVVAEQGAVRAEADLKPLADGTWAVRQHGPFRLWDTLEHAVTAFDALNQPNASRLGVSALNVPGKQYIWLDDPDSDHCWPLTVPSS